MISSISLLTLIGQVWFWFWIGQFITRDDWFFFPVIFTGAILWIINLVMLCIAVEEGE